MFSSSPLVSLVITVMYFSLLNCFALGGRNLVESDQFITFNVSSFFPTSTCQPSVQGPNRPASLKVTHAHGPCSKLSKSGKNIPTLAEVLARDQIRVASIQKRHASNVQLDASESTTTLPAGSRLYEVLVGVGTPAKYINLEIDTGSSLIWTQCEPCVHSCYTQQDPIFDPSKSSSYKNVSCNSAECSQLFSSTGYDRRCSESTCNYLSIYRDNTYSSGFLGNDRLRLTPNDVFDNIFFGCGELNRMFGNSAGVLGLGRDSLSVVSQTAQKYEKYFSYCLPTTSGSNGYLSFGKNEDTRHFVFTPFASSSVSTFYGVSIQGISLNGRRLNISPSVFQSGGSIIDSGTTVTRLAPTAYTALRDAFKQEMSKYPSAPAFSIFDTCYNFTNYKSVPIPIVSFIFAGNVKIDLGVAGTMLTYSNSNVCLAFASNKADTDIGVYGNMQQQTFEIAYDIAGGRLGFRQGGCS